MRAWKDLGYRRLASPLHATRAWIAATWVGALIAAALILSHPLALGALALALLLAGAGAGMGRRLARALRLAAFVAVPIVLVNVLVSRRGLTVFARLGDLGPFGQGDLTVEALVYGAVIALRVTIVVLATTLASLTIDPDELLALLRRRSFRSALTASLAVRMIPLLGADAARLAEAQRTRPQPPRGARGRARILGAVVAGALDRAMDVAATLEVRGLAGTGARLPRRGGARAALSRHDIAFLASGVALVVIVVAGQLSGADMFVAYPLIRAPVSVATVALATAAFAIAALPFLDRRGIAP